MLTYKNEYINYIFVHFWHKHIKIKTLNPILPLSTFSNYSIYKFSRNFPNICSEFRALYAKYINKIMKICCSTYVRGLATDKINVWMQKSFYSFTFLFDFISQSSAVTKWTILVWVYMKRRMPDVTASCGMFLYLFTSLLSHPKTALKENR